MGYIMKKYLFILLSIVASVAFASYVIPDAGVKTAKIADSAVTTAKIAANAVTDAKIQSGGLSTSSIANGAITAAKREALNKVSSNSGCSWSNNTSTYSEIRAVNITTSGRPIMLFLQPGTTGDSYGCSGVSGSCTSRFRFLRNGSFFWNEEKSTRGGTGLVSTFSSGSAIVIDTPSAGSYTYSWEGAIFSGNTASASCGMTLTAIEL